MNERERDLFLAGVYHCKTQLNLGQHPDKTTVRFVVDMSHSLLETLDKSMRDTQALKNHLRATQEELDAIRKKVNYSVKPEELHQHEKGSIDPRNQAPDIQLSIPERASATT